MQPLGADARAVRPYMPLISNSSYHFANHKVQSPKFKLQSQQIIKVKVQCSKFKAKVPTCVQPVRNTFILRRKMAEKNFYSGRATLRKHLVHHVGGGALVVKFVLHKVHIGRHMREKAVIARAEIVEPGVSEAVAREAILGTFAVAGKEKTTLLALSW